MGIASSIHKIGFDPAAALVELISGRILSTYSIRQEEPNWGWVLGGPAGKQQIRADADHKMAVARDSEVIHPVVSTLADAPATHMHALKRKSMHHENHRTLREPPHASRLLQITDTTDSKHYRFPPFTMTQLLAQKNCVVWFECHVLHYRTFPRFQFSKKTACFNEMCHFCVQWRRRYVSMKWTFLLEKYSTHNLTQYGGNKYVCTCRVSWWCLHYIIHYEGKNLMMCVDVGKSTSSSIFPVKNCACSSHLQLKTPKGA